MKTKYAILVRISVLYRIWTMPNGDQAVTDTLDEAEKLQKKCIKHYDTFKFNRPTGSVPYEEITITTFYSDHSI